MACIKQIISLVWIFGRDLRDKKPYRNAVERYQTLINQL